MLNPADILAADPTDQTVLATMVLAVWGGVLAETDRRTLRIPNRLLWPAAAAVILSGSLHADSIVAAGCAAGVYLVAFLLGGVGAGDVKLAGVLGGILAEVGVVIVFLGAAQLIDLATRRGRRRAPHGPALLGAFWLILALG